VPPILYKRTTTSAAMMRVETDVSNRLIAVVEELLKEREKNEDGSFLGINCTLALIRWLPKRSIDKSCPRRRVISANWQPPIGFPGAARTFFLEKILI